MAKTNLKINATNGYGDDISTTISYVNPDAGKNEILEFTQALNALTTNTYKETEKITTVNVDLETIPSTPTLTASVTTVSAATFVNQSGYKVYPDYINLTYSGDGQFVLYNDAILTHNLAFFIIKNAGEIAIRPQYAGTPTFPITFTVGFTKTDNYKAASIDITITA